MDFSSTSMADMVSVRWGGYSSSTLPDHMRVLKRIKLGVYTLISDSNERNGDRTTYNKQVIINRLYKHIKEIDRLYKQDFINYRGKTTDTSEYYSEVITGELLTRDVKALFNQITEVKRSIGYRVPSRTGVVTTGNEKSNRHEERLAIELFNRSKQGIIFHGLGKIIDYQVPLKQSLKDEGLGKIDLISVTDDTIYLIELKTKNNRETLLRCILEISTYYQILSKSIFLRSYSVELDTTKIPCFKRAILIGKDSTQFYEIKDIKNGHRNKLKQLISLFEIDVFHIDDDNNIEQMHF